MLGTVFFSPFSFPPTDLIVNARHAAFMANMIAAVWSVSGDQYSVSYGQQEALSSAITQGVTGLAVRFTVSTCRLTLNCVT